MNDRRFRFGGWTGRRQSARPLTKTATSSRGLVEPLEERRLMSYSTATVVDRHVFYNNSSYDGNDASANASDDSAIAPDKEALLPCEAATFANLTSYNAGINGIMIDVEDLPAGYTPVASDFEFKAGTSTDLSTWTTAAAPTSISVRTGAGTGGSDRITLTWSTGFIKQWLQVTVKEWTQIGLQEADTFFFGNLPGDTGAGDTSTTADVSEANDYSFFTSTGQFGYSQGITGLSDFNRNGAVNAADYAVLRNNLGQTLPFITSPPDAPKVATTEATNDHVLISWEGEVGHETYNIYRGTDETTRPSTPLATGVTTTSYLDTTATAGTRYFYWVEAVCGGHTTVPRDPAAGVDVPSAPNTVSYGKAAAILGLLVTHGNSTTGYGHAEGSLTGEVTLPSLDPSLGTFVSGSTNAFGFFGRVWTAVHLDNLPSTPPGTDNYYGWGAAEHTGSGAGFGESAQGSFVYSYGNTFVSTLHSNGPATWSSATGPTYDMQLDLEINVYDYSPWAVATDGAAVSGFFTVTYTYTPPPSPLMTAPADGKVISVPSSPRAGAVESAWAALSRGDASGGDRLLSSAGDDGSGSLLQ